MSRVTVESLEGRTLLSSAALRELSADVATTRRDTASIQKTLSADLKLVAGQLKAAQATGGASVTSAAIKVDFTARAHALSVALGHVTATAAKYTAAANKAVKSPKFELAATDAQAQFKAALAAADQAYADVSTGLSAVAAAFNADTAATSYAKGSGDAAAGQQTLAADRSSVDADASFVGSTAR